MSLLPIKPGDGMLYLASPYSHRNAAIREERFVNVCHAAGLLMRVGYLVFSPIAHTHPIAVRTGLPTDWTFWEQMDSEMVKVCACVAVLCLPGWEESRGCQNEVALAAREGIPTVHIQPKDLHDGVWMSKRSEG